MARQIIGVVIIQRKAYSLRHTSPTRDPEMQPLPTLETMIALCREAREEVLDLLNRDPELRSLRWRVDRDPCLYAIDAQGERLNDGSWVPWKRRKSDVEALLASYPTAVQIVVDGGVNAAENKDDYDATNYEPFYWQTCIWDRNKPVYSVEQLETLVARRTGFRSFAEMFDRSRGNYRPSIDVRDPEMLAIADHYDYLADKRGDERRAYRYGEVAAREMASEADLELTGGLRP